MRKSRNMTKSVSMPMNLVREVERCKLPNGYADVPLTFSKKLQILLRIALDEIDTDRTEQIKAMQQLLGED